MRQANAECLDDGEQAGRSFVHVSRGSRWSLLLLLLLLRIASRLR